MRREAPWRGSLRPVFLALSHHWPGGRLGSKLLSLGTPEERLSSFPPSPAPNPACWPRWRLRCQQEGEEGQSSVNVRRAEQLPGFGWGQGWRRERENGGGGRVSTILPFPECHIVGITQYGTFANWLLSFSNIRLSFFIVFMT